MEDESIGKRSEKRRKKIERRKIEREVEEKKESQSRRIELFIRLGILSLLALIIVDIFVSMYPIFATESMSFEMAAVSYYLMQGFGIVFGLGLYYAGKRVLRDTGTYSGVFQIDGSLIAIVNLTIFLIVNPLRYTQADLIVNSLYFGLETISSVTLLIFSLLVAFFFILVGTSSQTRPLKYIVMLTGVLWLVELFIPAFSPSPYVDPMTYGIIAGFSWLVYGLSAYCLWKMLYQLEALKAAPPPLYRIK